jgi:hypothetical protein
MGLTMVAGLIALVGLAVVVASLAYLHLAPTGLSPLRNAVSQYGISSFAAGYRVATIAFGIAGLALAAGIDGALSGAGRTVVVALLVVFAAARSAISWFPMDAPGTERTTTGRWHGLLAVTAFACVGLAAFKLATLLEHEQRWHNLAPESSALGWVMLALLLGMWLARSLPPLGARFGAMERAFYAAAIVWCSVFAIACAAGFH